MFNLFQIAFLGKLPRDIMQIIADYYYPDLYIITFKNNLKVYKSYGRNKKDALLRIMSNNGVLILDLLDNGSNFMRKTYSKQERIILQEKISEFYLECEKVPDEHDYDDDVDVPTPEQVNKFISDDGDYFANMLMRSENHLVAFELI